MLNWLRGLFITEDDKDPAFRALLRNILSVGFVALLFLTITQSGILTGTPKTDVLVVLSGVTLLTGLILVLTVQGILWPGKVFLPALLLILLTYITSTGNGLHDVSMAGFPVVIFLAAIFTGRRLVPFWTLLTASTVGLIGYWDITGITPEPVARTTGMDTIAVGMILVLAAGGVVNTLMARFEEIITRSRQNEQEQVRSNKELRDLQSSLEARIDARTVELNESNQRNERRAQQFQSIAQVARTISSMLDLDSLLTQITNVISREFGFYHVGIFLLDSAKEYAVLSAANSEGGHVMLTRGHRLKVGELGLVGFVSSTGRPRVALDTGADAVFFNNPNLPDTRSEIALPLRTGEEIIGVLDVQSNEPNAFSREDVNILSTLADQVSIAIQNARQNEETRKALAESEALSRQSVQAGWGQFTKRQNLVGIHHSGVKTTLLYTDKNAKETDDELKQTDQSRPKREGSVISLPIKLRGEVIGSVDVRATDFRQWDQDEMDIITAIIERAAIAMENSRLLEEAQRRASREQAIGELSAYIGTFTDTEAILRATVNEIGKKINGAKVVFELNTQDKDKR